jgi:hypothetical protein
LPCVDEETGVGSCSDVASTSGSTFAKLQTVGALASEDDDDDVRPRRLLNESDEQNAPSSSSGEQASPAQHASPSAHQRQLPVATATTSQYFNVQTSGVKSHRAGSKTNTGGAQNKQSVPVALATPPPLTPANLSASIEQRSNTLPKKLKSVEPCISAHITCEYRPNLPPNPYHTNYVPKLPPSMRDSAVSSAISSDATDNMYVCERAHTHTLTRVQPGQSTPSTAVDE